jgi:Spy/CpxP family protein refolding chaperone
MKKTLAILLAAFLMVMACAVSVYAEDNEGNEADDVEDADENEAGEGESGEEEGDSGDDEEENSVPGFELLFAAGAALVAARLIKACKL